METFPKIARQVVVPRLMSFCHARNSVVMSFCHNSSESLGNDRSSLGAVFGSDKNSAKNLRLSFCHAEKLGLMSFCHFRGWVVVSFCHTGWRGRKFNDSGGIWLELEGRDSELLKVLSEKLEKRARAYMHEFFAV